MRKSCLFSVLLTGLIVNGLKAQKDYLPGHLVLSSGDTLKGYIHYKNWERTPARIDFRKMPGAATETFTLGQLEGFEVTSGDKYTRTLLWKEVRPANLSGLRNAVQPRKLDTVFLRSIVESAKLSLYEYTDHRTRYYIRPAGDTLQELLYPAIYDEASGRTITRAVYRDQLKAWVLGHVDQQKLLWKVESASYREDDLKEIVLFLNGPGAPPSYVNSEKGIRIRQYFLSAGMTFHHIGRAGRESELSEYTHRGFLLNGGIDIFSLRRFQNLIFRSELRVGNDGYKGYTEERRAAGYTERTDLEWENLYFSPSFNLLYSFLRTEKTRFFGGVGVSYVIIRNTKYSEMVTNLSTGERKEEPYGGELGHGWGGSYINLGFMYNNRFELRAYRNLGGQLTPGSYSRLTGVLVGYRIK